MSRRPGFVVDHKQPADGGVSPNQYVVPTTERVIELEMVI